MLAARDLVLKTLAGKINDEELEMGKDGSGLPYSFDSKHGKNTFEVGVNAVTSKVLENKREGNHF